MKPSNSLIKLFIKLLILMMLFVVMFLISSFLYSARYWPDVYNYINANITIKRIPTLRELELTIVEVDYTTETYTTTDVDYIDITTYDDTDIDEFMKDEINAKRHVKRNVAIEPLKDYIELPSESVFVDYLFLNEPINESTTETAPKRNLENTFNSLVTVRVLEYESGDVFDEPEVIEKYYTHESTSTEKFEIRDELEPNTTLSSNVTTEMIRKEYLTDTEPITSTEAYVIGDRTKNIIDKLVEAAKILVAIKTYNNELDYDDQDISFLKDLVDETNLSTRSPEDVEMVSRKPEKIKMMPDPICHSDAFCILFANTVFPWVVTIFVTSNETQSQFSYICDGALITDRVIVTDARCMRAANKTWDPQNVLAFLGKGNLQSFTENEKVQKIKEIVLHPNFTVSEEGKVEHDLALLVMEDPVELKENIQTACIHAETMLQEAGTTAWSQNGALVPIFFNQNKSENCFDKSEDIACVTYGNDVALCPSYGGTFASKQANRWCLQGIFYGDPVNRGLCFSKDVHYTLLKNYLTWIDDTVGVYKNDIL